MQCQNFSSVVDKKKKKSQRLYSERTPLQILTDSIIVSTEYGAVFCWWNIHFIFLLQISGLIQKMERTSSVFGRTKLMAISIACRERENGRFNRNSLQRVKKLLIDTLEGET